MELSTSARTVVAVMLAAATAATWGAGVAEASLTGVSQADVSSGEVPANASSSDPDVSGNGRFVVFTSGASNLVAGDTNAADDVFLRDRATGTTRLVSTAGAPADGESSEASVSDDGRYVAFASTATNLDGGVVGTDSFVRDMVSGAVTRIGSGASSPMLSAGGRYVAYRSVSGVRRYDRTTGGTVAVNDGYSPQISGTGRYVVTSTFDDRNQPAYLYTDLDAGTTRDLLASAKASPGWDWDDDPSVPVLSTDGRYVGFSTDASGLVPADDTESEEVYLVDTADGDRYERVTGEYADVVRGYGAPLAISGNGRVIAFQVLDATVFEYGELVTLDRVTGLVSRVAPGFGIEDVALDHAGAAVVHETDDSRLLVGSVAQCTIDGTSGADVLTGTSGPDVICGRSGNDVIEGRGGDDVLAGGPGTDRVSFARSEDVVVRLYAWFARGAGHDEVHGFENVDGAAGADRILGDHRRNVLRGLGGDDLLVGHAAADTLVGGGGVDECDGETGADAATSCESVDDVP